MRYIQQSATGTIPFGPFTLDGVNPVTNIVASSLNGVIINNGITSSYSPSSFVYDACGQYLASTPTGFVSPGSYRVAFSNPSLFAFVWDDFTVLSPAVYGSLFGTQSIAPTDPWLTNLPGSYTGSQAGYVLGSQASIPIVGTVQVGATQTNFTLSISSGNAPVTADAVDGRGCLFKSGALIGAYPNILSSTIPSSNFISITASGLPASPGTGDIAWII
jgi:hypothetical protein